MILILMISIGLIGANSLVLSPIAAAVAVDLGADGAPAVMFASAVYGAGVALSALCLAPLSDKYGADVILRHSILVVVAALAISAGAPNLAALVVAQGVVGVGAGMALPAIYGLAAVISKPGQEARTLGKVLTGWTLSMVGGVTLSAYITDLFGWRMVYGVLALGLFVMLLMFYLRPFPAAPKSGQFNSPIGAFRIAGVLPGLFAVAMMGLGFYGAYNYIGAHLVEDLGYAVSAGGLLTLFYGIGFALSMFVDPLIDRLGARPALIGFFGLMSAFYLFMASISGTYIILAFAMAGWGALQHVGLTITVGRLGMIDPSRRGTILGLNSFVMYLTVFISTVAFRPLYEGHGLALCFVASGVLAFAGMVEALLWRQKAPLQAA